MAWLLLLYAVLVGIVAWELRPLPDVRPFSRRCGYSAIAVLIGLLWPFWAATVPVQYWWIRYRGG
jgi:hypothetical protein